MRWIDELMGWWVESMSWTAEKARKRPPEGPKTTPKRPPNPTKPPKTQKQLKKPKLNQQKKKANNRQKNVQTPPPNCKKCSFGTLSVTSGPGPFFCFFWLFGHSPVKIRETTRSRRKTAGLGHRKKGQKKTRANQEGKFEKKKSWAVLRDLWSMIEVVYWQSL